MLQKNKAIKWNKDYQATFETIKQYLQEPTILMPPIPGRPLIMYLTMLDNYMWCVLGKHEEIGRKENIVYYLTKKLTVCETRDSLLKKTYCELACATKCLRECMLTHTIWLISKMYLVKYIFKKPVLTGRIARWQVLLSEYDI